MKWGRNYKNISYIFRICWQRKSYCSSLLNLINTRTEGIHRIKRKCGYDDKKCHTFEIIYKYFSWVDKL